MAQAMIYEAKLLRKEEKKFECLIRHSLQEGKPRDALHYLLENLPGDYHAFKKSQGDVSVLADILLRVEIDFINLGYEFTVDDKVWIYEMLLKNEQFPFPYLLIPYLPNGLFPHGYEEKNKRTQDSPMWPNTKFNNSLHTLVHEFCYGVGSEALYDNDTLRRLLQGFKDNPDSDKSKSPDSPKTPDKLPPKKRKSTLKKRDVSTLKKQKSTLKEEKSPFTNITEEEVKRWSHVLISCGGNDDLKWQAVFGKGTKIPGNVNVRLQMKAPLHPDRHPNSTEEFQRLLNDVWVLLP